MAEVSSTAVVVAGTCLCGATKNLLAFDATTFKGKKVLVARCARCLFAAVDAALDTKYARTLEIGLSARAHGRAVRRTRKRVGQPSG